MKDVFIAQPCPKKWDNMTPIDGSTKRHCQDCNINLVDFSTYTNEEIIHYLNTHTHEKTCAKVGENVISQMSFKEKVRSEYTMITQHFKGIRKFAMLSLLILSLGLTSCYKHHVCGTYVKENIKKPTPSNSTKS